MKLIVETGLKSDKMLIAKHVAGILGHFTITKLNAAIQNPPNYSNETDLCYLCNVTFSIGFNTIPVTVPTPCTPWHVNANGL